MIVPLDTPLFHLGFNLQAEVNENMSDPIRREIAEELHALSFEEDIACDYHDRPKTISKDEVLIEAIRLIDHPQLRLEEWPDGWILDAARCSDCGVETIEEPTKGFEEALVILPVNRSNNVVSVDTPEPSDVSVLAYSPATEGCHPMTISQMLMDAADPDDVGIARWIRIKGALDGAPDPLRAHLEQLIKQSNEVPTSL